MSEDPVIRVLTLAEISTLLEWAHAEGWNPGLGDAAAFRAADPDGFIGCFVNDQMAAGMSAVRYGSDFGFIGLYIAHPDFRGKGHGRRVWDAGIARLEGRVVGLDGVPEQQANYRSMGFVSAYETQRWSGRPTALHGTDASDFSMDMALGLLHYDRAFFPAQRTTFLTEWMRAPRRTKVLSNASGILGYAVSRPCQDGVKIGPLFADGPASAMTLFRAAAAQHPDADIHIDVPVGQEAFGTFLDGVGLTPGFLTARMYRGDEPAMRHDQIFAVTTLELG